MKLQISIPTGFQLEVTFDDIESCERAFAACRGAAMPQCLDDMPAFLQAIGAAG